MWCFCSKMIAFVALCSLVTYSVSVYCSVNEQYYMLYLLVRKKNYHWMWFYIWWLSFIFMHCFSSVFHLNSLFILFFISGLSFSGFFCKMFWQTFMYNFKFFHKIHKIDVWYGSTFHEYTRKRKLWPMFCAKRSFCLVHLMRNQCWLCADFLLILH